MSEPSMLRFDSVAKHFHARSGKRGRDRAGRGASTSTDASTNAGTSTDAGTNTDPGTGTDASVGVTVALDGVSFEVPRGQFCAVIGPSGSGKSTLLRLVNGMLEPTRGKVLFAGQPITRRTVAAVQRRVGTVHQQFDLVPRLSVLDNVLSGAAPVVSTARVLLGLWPASYQHRACALLERVGMAEEHLHRRAAELSGGQQQRVAIARAFMLDPAVVLADEPVASLDPATSRSVLGLLREASRESAATVLCSLHQVDLASEFADRVIAIRAGRLAYQGPPDSLDPALLESIYGDALTRSPDDRNPAEREVLSS